MQANPKTALLTLAQADPKWFYELCRGMFPKDLFIEAEMNLSSMSPEDIKAEIVALIKATPELVRWIRAIDLEQEVIND